MGRVNNNGHKENKNGQVPPPHSPEAEQSVIGAILISPDAYRMAQPILGPQDFYDIRLGEIYKAAGELERSGSATDVVTIYEQIKRSGLDEQITIPYLVDLQSKVPSIRHTLSHAQIIRQYSLKRQLNLVADVIKRRSLDPGSDALDNLASAENDLVNLSRSLQRSTMYSPAELADKVEQSINEMLRGKRNFVPTGFNELDGLINGFHNSDMIVIAARTSVGKTRLALSIIFSMTVLSDARIGLLTIEMSAEQIFYDLISYLADEPIARKLRSGQINEIDQMFIDHFLKTFREKNSIIIDEAPRLTVDEFKAKARIMKANYDIQVLFLDYIQLVKAPGSRSQEEQVAIASAACKEIAKELSIPVVAMAQLNRESESDKNVGSEPQVWQMRWSGAIEQDADIIILIERPEQYGRDLFADKTDAKGRAKLHVKKNRLGTTGSLTIVFDKNIARFRSFRPSDAPQYEEPPSF